MDNIYQAMAFCRCGSRRLHWRPDSMTLAKTRTRSIAGNKKGAKTEGKERKGGKDAPGPETKKPDFGPDVRDLVDTGLNGKKPTPSRSPSRPLPAVPARLRAATGLAFVLCLLCVPTTGAVTIEDGTANAASTSLPLPYPTRVSFEKNLGQWDAQAHYRVQSADSTAFLAAGRLAFVQPAAGGAHAVFMDVVGANLLAPHVESDPQPQVSNYLLGSGPAGWVVGVPHFGEVRYLGIYPFVDLVYHGANGALEYDFVVQPGASPDAIRLRFQGLDGPATLDPDGDLLLPTPSGTLRQAAPVTYQVAGDSRQPVASAYRLLADGTVGFDVGAYDPSKPLVVDPLVSSTYLGSSQYDYGDDVAVDSAGNAYVTGLTASSSAFPTTAGAFQTTRASTYDAFVTKVSPTGTLLYSTYLGGGADDEGMAIAADAAGNVYVAGRTSSTNFPTTSGAHSRTKSWYDDIFVAQINPAGSALVFSTYLGGMDNEHADGVAVDASGNAYVTGKTLSTDFPTTAGAFRRTFYSVFAAKVTPAGALAYSTFLGDGDGNGIAVDASGNAYLTGTTTSTTFPTTAGAYSSSGGTFVSKLNAAGSGLAYSTYGNGMGGADIATDVSGNAYVAGSAVMKLNAAGTAVVYSYPASYGEGIAVDASGNAYVAGWTGATTFPTTTGAYQTSNAGANDAFVLKLSPSGGLAYSTYLGGAGSDYASGIAVDSSGNPVVTGWTGSANFPTTAGAYRRTQAGQDDVFVARIDPRPATAPTAPVLQASVSGAQQVRLTWQAPASDGGSAVLSYNVFRSTTAGGETLVTSGGCSNLGNVLTCTDAGLSAGTTYYYQVNAVNQVGPGPRSNEASATAATSPSAAQSLQAAPGGPGQARLDWHPPASDGGSDVTNYRVYRGSSAGGSKTLLTEGGCANLGNVLTCTDSGLAGGTTYYYQVRAVNALGEGPDSNEAGMASPPSSSGGGGGDSPVDEEGTCVLPPAIQVNQDVDTSKVFEGRFAFPKMVVPSLPGVCGPAVPQAHDGDHSGSLFSSNGPVAMHS
jgi:hypothetical protein